MSAYKAENIKKEKLCLKIAEFVNKIPWVINCNAEVYWEGENSKGIRTIDPIGQGFNMSESMINWLFGYMDGIKDWEEKNGQFTRKVPKVR